jgi:signal transduction histidine kinase
MPRKIKTSLATKFSLTFAALFMITMVSVTYGVRQIIIAQFIEEYEREVSSALHSIQLDLESRYSTVKQQLQQFAKSLRDDNDFLLHAFALKDVNNPVLIDYAGTYMSAMGLQVLEIANEKGVVLSSGQARNTFGKRVWSRISRLRTLDSRCGLAWFDKPAGKILCLTVLESVRVGNQRFYLMGGMEVTPTFLMGLQNDSTDCVLLQLPTSAISSSREKTDKILEKITSDENHEASISEFEKEYTVADFQLPLVIGNSIADATVYLLRPKTNLIQLLNKVNRRIFLISGIGILMAIILSVWLTRSVAMPLQRLALSASNLSADNLRTRFVANGNDEVGVLGEALRNMLKRLRLSRMRLAAAERKAALAEIARELNHDIKNGFFPIRSVMQHWQEVADNESEKLVEVFNQRKSTVIESLDYLENLARSYLRFQPAVEQINVNNVIENLLDRYKEAGNRDVKIQTDFTPLEPSVQADELQLRRAFENVLQNSLEALSGRGTISVLTEVSGQQVIITWRDTGDGIPGDRHRQLFKPNFTTKEGGTGLGLVNVKRIIEGCGGTLEIESEVGTGTTVRMVLSRFPDENQTPELKTDSVPS